MPKRSLCGRCFLPTPSTTTERLTFGTSSYDIDLCDAHADALRRDLYSWTRCGRPVEENPLWRRPLTPADDRLGTVKASYVHVPSAGGHIVEAQPEAVPPPPEPASLPHLRIVGDIGRWRMSEHALERSVQRGISVEDAVLAAESPDLTVPGRNGAHIHTRGDVNAVVDRERCVILTVTNRINIPEQLEVNHG